MTYALMKTTELNMLWKLVKAGESRPLTAADFRLLLRLRAALQTYQAETGQPAPGPLPGKGGKR
jgi:hypothetical protein